MPLNTVIVPKVLDFSTGLLSRRADNRTHSHRFAYERHNAAQHLRYALIDLP
jgi:hypothetical protein